MALADEDGDVCHFYHLAPIGCIVAWHKTMTGVPSLPAAWVECDGSAISDAESPMNGQTLPDMNSTQSFLRGASASGSTGGSDTKDLRHTHTVDISGWSGSNIAPGGTYGDDGSSGTALTTTEDILPTYVEVVWIMRIK